MSHEKVLSPYEEFNLEIPEDEFPAKGITPGAAAAITESAMWTDSNPMLNLSSLRDDLHGSRSPRHSDAAREHQLCRP